MHQLDGAFRKLKRADEHIQSLKDESNRFLEEKPFDRFLIVGSEEAEGAVTLTLDALRLLRLDLADISGWQDLGSGLLRIPTVSQQFSVMLRKIREEPSLNWGVILGDVVHNLRSALDQMVWELTTAYQSKSNPSGSSSPRPSQYRNVKFPITDQEGESWHDARRKNLWGIDPGLLQRFEELQPWFGGRNHMKDPLWRLREFCNQDKHRQIQLVFGVYNLKRMGVRMASGVLGFQRLKVGREEPVVGDADTEIARYRVDRARLKGTQSQVEVDADLEFAIAFDQSSPGNREKVVNSGVEVGHNPA